MTAAAPADRPLRWMRLLAIAIGAVILASCRSLPSPAVLAGGAVAMPAAPQADSHTAAPPPHDGGWEAEVRSARVPDTDGGVHPAGLEAPCPPLPRLGGPPAGGCGDGQCGPACPPQVCIPCDRPPPLVPPCLVCDGGDGCAPARPFGAEGIANLTAGDTVARYRAADDGPDTANVHVAVSNCACVYAPRFSSVREVVRPLEDAVPAGPRGLATDTQLGEQTRRQPVWGSTQNVAVENARKALPGVAVEENLGPLAVDQGDLPHEDDGVAGPVERLALDQPELAARAQRPLVQVGFDVPIAWTCVKGANVLVAGRTAQTVSVADGTATLRFEEPGRAELTLCKRAGSDTARTGEELDFTIFMLNSCDRPLTDVVLVDALPDRLRLVPQSAASSLPADFSTEQADDGAVVLRWKIKATLRPGESGFVRFRTLVQ
ncbi:MAG: hypothetical protein ACKOC4_06175 [Planctomycetia bacterium]